MGFCLNAACISNIGKVRENNEDNFYFDNQILPKDNLGVEVPICQEFIGNRICFGVFDGMGGHADGQLASYLAANNFRKNNQQVSDTSELSDEFFYHAVTHMNDIVWEKAEQLDNNMGTTAVMIGFYEDMVYICNVGDSRAYRFRKNNLRQISIDHVESISVFKDSYYHRKPRLSQCIGMPPEELLLEPYLAEGIIKKDDIFVLCSDGLTDMVSEQEISEILSKRMNTNDCVQELLDRALQNGGRDNITIIVIQIMEADETEEEDF